MRKKLTLFILFMCHSLVYTAQSNIIGIFQNIGQRKTQEDRYDTRQVGGGRWFGVYDGHGGDTESKFLASDSGLAHIFSKTSPTLSIKERLKQAFATADQQSQHDLIGSTASIVYIKDGIMHFAHVGDSRAIIPGVFTTSDHKPDRPDEKERIESAGGEVVFWGVHRVCGIAVSRAIGDHAAKKFVISEPEYTQVPLTKNCSHLIIASDGLYDVMTNDDITTIITENSEKLAHDFACKLGNIALQKGSTDNITVMVIDLQKLAGLPHNNISSSWMGIGIGASLLGLVLFFYCRYYKH